MVIIIVHGLQIINNWHGGGMSSEGVKFGGGEMWNAAHELNFRWRFEM